GTGRRSGCERPAERGHRSAAATGRGLRRRRPDRLGGNDQRRLTAESAKKGRIISCGNLLVIYQQPPSVRRAFSQRPSRTLSTNRCGRPGGRLVKKLEGAHVSH